MTPNEALKEIISRPKWYLVLKDDGINRDLHKESTLRVTALRILNGTAKPDTMKRFFDRFGYDVEVSMEVNRK